MIFHQTIGFDNVSPTVEVLYFLLSSTVNQVVHIWQPDFTTKRKFTKV